MQPYPPLQTLMVAALLRERGHSVALFDATLAGRRGRYSRRRSTSIGRELVAVIEDNFNFLTKMCLTRNRELAFRMCAAARRARVFRAVVNGSDSTDRAAEYLNAGFEMVIAGEVEKRSTSAHGCAAQFDARLKRRIGMRSRNGGRCDRRISIRFRTLPGI